MGKHIRDSALFRPVADRRLRVLPGRSTPATSHGSNQYVGSVERGAWGSLRAMPFSNLEREELRVLGRPFRARMVVVVLLGDAQCSLAILSGPSRMLKKQHPAALAFSRGD